MDGAILIKEGVYRSTNDPRFVMWGRFRFWKEIGQRGAVALLFRAGINRVAHVARIDPRQVLGDPLCPEGCCPDQLIDLLVYLGKDLIEMIKFFLCHHFTPNRLARNWVSVL